jgi:hypothetical protein
VCNAVTYTNHDNGLLPAYNLNPVTGAEAASPSYTPGNWGTTAAAVEADFPVNFLGNLEHAPAANAQLSAAQISMWANISTTLHRTDPTNVYIPAIMEYAAKNFNLFNLLMFRAVMGPTFDTYVADYTTGNNKVEYDGQAKINPVWLSWYYFNSKGIAIPSFSSQTSYAAEDVLILTYTYGTDYPVLAMHKATTYLQVRMKLGLVEIVAIAGLVVAVGAWLDPQLGTQIADLYHQLTTPTAPDTTYWPDVPAPGSLPPMQLPLSQIVPYDPTAPTLPASDWGDDDQWYSVCGNSNDAWC